MVNDDVLRNQAIKMLAEFGGGARRFEESIGLKKWALRGLLDPDRKQSPSLQKAEELATALGLDFYIGPPRSDTVLRAIVFSASNDIPNHGLAKCGIVGWFNDRDDGTLPAPDGLVDPDAFYVRAQGHSMNPEGITSGSFCLVSPGRVAQIGDRVYIEDDQGKVSIKRLIDEDDENYHLRGWLAPDMGQQKDYRDQRLKSGIIQISPVIAVFRLRPAAGERPEYVPDPRGDEHQKVTGAGWRIPQSLETVPLVGYAGAGGEVAFDGSFDPTEEAPAPPSGGEHLAVVEVRGDSANPFLREGDRVYFRPDQTARPDDHIGRLVLATTIEGAAYIKILRRGDSVDKWNLESINPRYRVMEDVALSRISPLIWIHFNGSKNPFQKM